MKRLRLLPALLLLVLATVSCDNNFNSLGGGLIGGQLDSLPLYQAGVVAYGKKIGPVQTNGLAANLLGVYNDPVYGEENANVQSQLTLSATSPDFGTDPVLDSVIISLPLYSSKQDSVAGKTSLYKLDSIYGDSPFKLSISRSNFFLNDFDPDANFENAQKYYSNQGPLFESNLTGDPLFEGTVRFSEKEVVDFVHNTTGGIDTTRLAPQLRLKLPVAFFKQAILDKQGNPVLSTQNNFKNYLRGLYFKSESENGNGSMALFNFRNSNAGITLYYKSSKIDSGDFDGDGNTTEILAIPSSFKLNFNGNIVNTFSENFTENISTKIAASSEVTGAKNLYLKGGEGSLAVIKLFEDDAELQQLRDNNWLVNEANLVFHVNQDEAAGGSFEPERVYLYDLDNNRPLYDYAIDPTQNSANPLTSLTLHSERLIRDTDGNGLSYKIRITEHVNNLINNDSTNVKLGLVVTQNINLINNVVLKNKIDSISRIPQATVITPEGTVLYGNLANDADKRLKFNIYYTKTNK